LGKNDRFPPAGFQYEIEIKDPRWLLRDQFRNCRLKYASCRWTEEQGKKLRRRVRIGRRFVKIKRIGFVAIQHIMETPEEEEGDTFFAQCTCLSLHSCI
jgi:hypothetical protein